MKLWKSLRRWKKDLWDVGGRQPTARPSLESLEWREVPATLYY